MGPKKKASGVRNAFYFFMQEQRSVLVSEGYTWKNTEELVALCSPRWKSVCEERRSVYKQMAKEHKASEDKYDASGRSLRDIQMELEKKEQLIVNMRRHIKAVINESQDVLKQTFNVVHVNSMCETQDNVYLPCQLAMARFSLKKGLEVVANLFIKPKNIPMGYAYAMEKRAKDSHMLSNSSQPIEKAVASQYADMVAVIMSFFDKKDKLVVFTDEEDVPKVTQTLENLFEWADIRNDVCQFNVYTIQRLFFELTQLSSLEGARLYVEADAKERLAQEAYSYSLDVACSYHEANDRSRYCSLFYVKKWVFIICDYCSFFFNFELHPGRHYPGDSAVDEDDEKPEGPVLKRLDFTDYMDPDEVSEDDTNRMYAVDTHLQHCPKYDRNGQKGEESLYNDHHVKGKKSEGKSEGKGYHQLWSSIQEVKPKSDCGSKTNEVVDKEQTFNEDYQTLDQRSGEHSPHQGWYQSNSKDSFSWSYVSKGNPGSGQTKMQSGLSRNDFPSLPPSSGSGSRGRQIEAGARRGSGGRGSGLSRGRDRSRGTYKADLRWNMQNLNIE